jgi:hypothetical protein
VLPSFCGLNRPSQAVTGAIARKRPTEWARSRCSGAYPRLGRAITTWCNGAVSPTTQPGGRGHLQPGTDRPSLLAGARRVVRLDFSPVDRQPAALLVALATIVAVVGSLLACAGIVAGAKALFSSTANFSHFELSDYGTLTVVGVLVASAGWPVVTRVTSMPRWLFFRLAIVVTLVLWLPDAWLFLRGENSDGVAVLMVMHLVIAVVTYNALVHIAAVRTAPAADPSSSGLTGALREPRQLSPRAVRRAWNLMALLVGMELVLGIVTIVLVPYSRSGGVVPSRNGWIFVLHGGVGAALGAGALGVLVVSATADRLARIGAVLGAVGVGVGLVGGLLATVHSSRLLGVGLMLVGVVVAGIGYLVPAMEEMGRKERERAGLPPARRPSDR